MRDGLARALVPVLLLLMGLEIVHQFSGAEWAGPIPQPRDRLHTFPDPKH